LSPSTLDFLNFAMSGDLLLQLRDAAPAILLLIVLEGLLSVDNMLAIASLASCLPEDRRKAALRLGLIGAYAFRALALVGAAFIAGHRVMLVLGACYLLHLAADHFSGISERHENGTTKRKPRTFWRTVVAIQFLDLSLSLDNVVVAVGVAPGQMWVVYTGVFLGLLTLWLFASLSLKLIHTYPVLTHAAFLLITYVGILLLLEAGFGWHVSRGVKFSGSAAIIGLCLLYERWRPLQKICAPVFRMLRVPVKWYALVTGGLLAAMTWPFRKMMRGGTKE
jgi:YkoY family integral membrane protein